MTKTWPEDFAQKVGQNNTRGHRIPYTPSCSPHGVAFWLSSFTRSHLSIDVSLLAWVHLAVKKKDCQKWSHHMIISIFWCGCWPPSSATRSCKETSPPSWSHCSKCRFATLCAKLGTKSPRIFEFLTQIFLRQKKFPELSRTFRALFRWGKWTTQKIHQTSRRFSMSSPQAISKNRFTKAFWGAGKPTIRPLREEAEEPLLRPQKFREKLKATTKGQNRFRIFHTFSRFFTLFQKFSPRTFPLKTKGFSSMRTKEKKR